MVTGETSPVEIVTAGSTVSRSVAELAVSEMVAESVTWTQ
jgi:hypothetical protein